MKNILYISYDGLTDSLGESQVLNYLIRLSSERNKITLISFEKKEKSEQLERIKKKAIKHNIKWIHFNYSKNPPILSTLFDLSKCLFYVLFNLRSLKPNLIHCRSYIAGSVSLILYYITRVPLIFDMRGWMIDENIERGSWSGPLFKPVIFVFRWIENRLILKSKYIVSLTNKSKKIIVDRYKIDPNNIYVIPTCVDRDLFCFDIEQRVDIRREFGLHYDDFLLVYSGSIGGYYNINEILRFYKSILKFNSNTFLLLLTSSSKDIVLNCDEINDLDIKKIIFKTCTFNNVYKYLSSADAGLVLYDNSFSSDGRSPTKLGEYIACGLRVFAPNNVGDLNEYFVSDLIGVQFNLYDLSSYEKSIIKFLDSNYSKDYIIDNTTNFLNIIDGVNSYSTIYDRG